MKIIFFGNPEFCNHPLLKLNNSNHSIISVVTNKDKRSGRGLKLNQTFVKKLSLDLNLPVIEINDINSKDFYSKLTSLKADLFIVVAFSILPDSIINIPKYGSINIHPSLLPKYKGLNTHKRVLKNNDKYSGCTVHYVNSKLDSGKIILQSKILIDKFETVDSLKRKILIQEHKLYPLSIISVFR